MLALFAPLPLAYLVLLPFFFRLLRTLRTEVNYLPERTGALNAEGAHPSVGLVVPDACPYGNWFGQKPLVIMVADPHCSSCKRELEEVLLHNKGGQRVPVVVFLRNRKDERTQVYADMYGSVIAIVLLEEPEYERLNITVNPSYLVVDGDGVITSVQSHYLLARKLVAQRDSLQKAGE